MMMDSQRDIYAFERWCVEHHIEIDERLEIRTSSLDNSISIYTKSNVDIAIGETLVRIPKAMVFSTANCSNARGLAPWLTHANPTLDLALALVAEQEVVGHLSPWHGYLSLLPKQVVDIAPFWHLYGDHDGIEARQWLRGTEAENILTPPLQEKKGSGMLLEHINAYFETVAKPILQREFGTTKVSLPEFHRAYSIVSSRAFFVDAYLGLSLVPFADIFNHIENNHVHLETDYHVCPICGSFQECGHDTGGAGDDWQLVSPSYTAEDTCEMVANLPIGGDEEVFNTYEDGLTNAQLLCHYGFMLDGNENDTITWSLDELLEGEKDVAKAELEGVIKDQWKLLISRLNHWKGTQRVYNPAVYHQQRKSQADKDGSGMEENDELAGSFSSTLNPTPECCLNVNADGQVSLQLWVLLFVIALANDKRKLDPRGMIELIYSLTGWQERLEGQAADDDPGSSSCNTNRANEGNREVEHRALEPTANIIDEKCIVQKIAGLVIEICGQKLQSVHASELSEQQIGEILDNMPVGEKRLTQVSMKYAIETRSILRSCQTSWTELTEFIQDQRKQD